MTEVEPLNSFRRLPLRVEDFFLLDASGAFADYGKTELIDGGIVFMNAQHRPHSRIKGQLFLALNDVLNVLGLSVLIEATVAMPPHNAPEPDLIVTNDASGDGPVPLASIRLLIEVSDATLATDLGSKAQLYACQGVPEYWVADVEGRRIQQMWSPSANGYAEQREHKFGDIVEAATISGLTVATSGLG